MKCTTCARELPDPTYELRPSCANDLPFVFWCRNDPLTRAMSARTYFIEWQEFARWNVQILFANGRPVGYGRIVSEDGIAEISYVISPSERRRGHGTALVKMLVGAAPGLGIMAEIKVENLASIECAKRAGLVPGEVFDGMQIFSSPPLTNYNVADGWLPGDDGSAERSDVVVG